MRGRKAAVKKGGKPGNTRGPSSGRATTRAGVNTSSRRPARKKNPTPPRSARTPAAPSAHRRRFPIVGIGASAGGLETFAELLANLPINTGMAFVYVQHLDPHHESLLTTLLAKSTAMPTHEARHGMTIEPNHVYVIPPNTDLGIHRGRLTMQPRSESHQPHMSVDHFLRALATDLNNGAIGVILSGTASDGVQGLKAIKEVGGLTFAQDPEEAKYDGMPRSAINADAVDKVLKIKELAKELARVGAHPYLALATIDEDIPRLEPDDLDGIFRLLRRHRGVDFAHYKPTTIKRRIARRMAINRIDDLSSYTRHLENSPTELDALYQDALINVTSFFRDPEASEALSTVVLPKLLKSWRNDAPFRAWICGCATGEEAYSLAILLLEHLGEAAHQIQFQIFATDISDVALDKARRGVYPKAALAHVSAERLSRFFIKAGGGYQVKKMLRDMCLFAHHDLSRDPPFSRVDLISCRNVLIYLNATVQKKIIPTFDYALNPAGVLILGQSETIGSFADRFSLIDKKNKFYLKKHTTGRPLGHNARADLTTPIGGAGLNERSAGPRATVRNSAGDINQEVDRVVLAKYAPASVLVNDDLDILQFRGETGDYLQPAAGPASLNLLKMARAEMTLELRRIMHQARKQNAVVRSDGVRLKSNGGRHRVTVEATPVKLANGKERYFLVTFESRAARNNPPVEVAHPTRANAKIQRILELEQELTANREYLRSTIEAQESTNEELRSAVEEIQSSNEELQSVNEELETAKEELQSTNEELTTVNEELRSRNVDLIGVNDDLVNLLNSVHVPIIILDNDLRIRRFTPVAQKILGVIDTDVGRPFSDLRLSASIPDLQHHINEVLHSLAAKECETQDQRGHWYSVRIRPYRTVDNKINGVVLTLVEIDDIKNNLLQAQTARDYAEAVIATVRGPLLVLDRDLKVVSASRAFYQMFQTTAAETLGHRLYDLDGGNWSIPRLSEQLDTVLQKHSRFDEFEVESQFRDGHKRLLLNAACIERKMDGNSLILLAMEDITARHDTA